MQRVRPTGGSSSPAPYTPSEQPKPAQADTNRTLPTVAVSPAAVIATSADEKSEPVEMSPRAVAPEKRIDLSTLREVANLSAAQRARST